MMMKKSQTLFVSMMTAAFFMSSAPNVYAGSPCEGSSNMTAEQQHVLPVTEADGHILMLSQDSGPMKSVGMIGNGTATDRGMNRLFQGNGEGQGYHTLKTDEGTVVVQWLGTVKTTLKDDRPNTTFEGNWEIIKGSGKFQDSKGQGSYNGYFTSETTRVVNWKGTCSLAATK